jgi:D-glutamate cyclase
MKLGKEKFSTIEELMAHDVGRGSRIMSQHTSGCLLRAVESLLSIPKLQVVILTGFFIPSAAPPAAETDGPVGAAQVAAAIDLIGGSVRVLTDEPCASAVQAALAAANIRALVDIAPLPDRVGDAAYTRWESELLDEYRRGESPVSHMISIERVGANASGQPCNMRGEDLSQYTAPLEKVFAGGSWTTIAIGDGGNEIGMGYLDAAVIEGAVKLGRQIRCITGCDSLLVGGTSNWAAAGLVAGLAVAAQNWSGKLAELLIPAWSQRVLSSLVINGPAVDGVTRRPEASVDGLDWNVYSQILCELRELI